MADPIRFLEPAYIYVIGAADGPQKIGKATDAASRRAMLQTGNPATLLVHHAVQVNREVVYQVEKYVHELLSAERVRGEWFNVSPTDAAAAIETALEALFDRILDAPIVTVSATGWQRRLVASGLTTKDLAKLAGVGEPAIKAGMNGRTKDGRVPVYLQTIIRLWEVSDRKAREAILAEPAIDPES